MNCKLTINLNSGLLDVEGSENFVKKIYYDFKVLIDKYPPTKNENTDFIPTTIIDDSKELSAISTPKEQIEKPSEVSESTDKKRSISLTFLNELDLNPFNKVSLTEFASLYPVKTSEELSLLIVYYLRSILNETVTLNHIFTCLTVLGKNIPKHLKQVLTNNKNAKFWIDVSDWNAINYTPAGFEYMQETYINKIANN